MDLVNLLATDPTPHLFWITSRSAGIAALALASLAVSVGLLAHTRVLRKVGKANLRVTHESLSLATIAMIVVHGATLLGDSFLRPSVLDLTIPFVSSYRTIWTSLGIVAGWGLVILGLSYYARRWIGVERWRVLHRFTALAWLLGIAHSLGEGTDAGQLWFLAMIAVVALPALGLLAWRTVMTRTAGPSPRPRREAPVARAARPTP